MVQTNQTARAVPQARDVLASGALLLDLDGTLIDFAARPDAVYLPASLLSDLTFLHDAMAGAVAIVTGRRLDDVDALLAPLRLPIAAEHGGMIRRLPSGEVSRLPVSVPPPGWDGAGWDAAGRVFAASHPGVVHEMKSAGFVLHYRQAPDLGDPIRAFLEELAAGEPGFEILRAAMAWELRPRGVHKGLGVRSLMAHAPFAGRTPFFIGDDVTDEDGIGAAEALGGAGFRVADDFGSPAGVRAWLASLRSAGHDAAT